MAALPLSHAATLDAPPSCGEKTLTDDPFVTGDTIVAGAGAPRLPDAPKLTGGSRRTVVPRVVEEAGQTKLVQGEEERYRRESVIGQGGMGEVAKAFDRDIGRTVAVKRMLTEVTSPTLVARFVDEVRTLGRLHHPNIVPIHDVDLDPDGNLFFTMPIVDGVPLDALMERLEKRDPETLAAFPLSRRMDVFAGIVDALGHAHERNVVHRDVKPANVIVGPFGEVVLLDWGIARLDGEERPGSESEDPLVARTSEKTRHGHVVGTPHYMAPEQARGDVSAIGPATDLYAAFVVLYEMLTLTTFVKAETATLALAEVASKVAPAPESAAYVPEGSPIVPAELRHFLRHGLDATPARRYPSAAAVLAELARIRSGDFKIECPVTFSKRASTVYFRFVERSPMLGLALLGSVLALALSSIVLAVILAIR